MDKSQYKWILLPMLNDFIIGFIFFWIGKAFCSVFEFVFRKKIKFGKGGYIVVGMVVPPILLLLVIYCDIFYDWIGRWVH